MEVITSRNRTGKLWKGGARPNPRTDGWMKKQQFRWALSSSEMQLSRYPRDT